MTADRDAVTRVIDDLEEAAAEDALLDRRMFHLNEEEHQAFLAALDAPPRPSAELRKLLVEPAAWER